MLTAYRGGTGSLAANRGGRRTLDQTGTNERARDRTGTPKFFRGRPSDLLEQITAAGGRSKVSVDKERFVLVRFDSKG